MASGLRTWQAFIWSGKTHRRYRTLEAMRTQEMRK
jgi:hypothetical protein